MIGDNNIKELVEIAGVENCLENEPMKKHTTFRIGGPARLFISAQSVDVLKKVLVYCREHDIKYFILGNGSNLLVSDKGFDGVIIQIFKNLSSITREENRLRVMAGALLSSVAAKAYEAGLTGFEFASGIPGTLGGAVMMNAGAYGGEMKQVIVNACVLTSAGEIAVIPADLMELGYRTSVFAKNQDIVLSAQLKLEYGNEAVIREYMDELKEQRVSKQPLEYPSAGSTFKRPEGYFAGKLIQDAGLRGFQVGGAQVSEKHCGFVINKDHATATDILSLMEQVSDKVEAKFGVRLEPEVKIIGEK